jgi:hypothetical protein
MLKEYVIDIREFDGKLRELISTGLQEHAFKLGWKGWPARDNPGEVFYTDKKVLYFDSDGSIAHNSFIDDAFDNTLITPADFLALTTEDVQDNSGTASAACTDKKPKFEPKQWVLVRDSKEHPWYLDIYSHYDDEEDGSGIHFMCVGSGWRECIPYDGNEHLCGQVGEP